MHLICLIIQVFIVVCVARVILSWFPVQDNGIIGGFANLLVVITEPLFSTVRRSLPMPGDLPIDLSPMVIIIGLGVLRTIVCSI